MAMINYSTLPPGNLRAVPGQFIIIVQYSSVKSMNIHAKSNYKYLFIMFDRLKFLIFCNLFPPAKIPRVNAEKDNNLFSPEPDRGNIRDMFRGSFKKNSLLLLFTVFAANLVYYGNIFSLPYLFKVTTISISL